MYFQLQDHMENHCRKSKLPCYFAELGCKKMVHKKPILSFSCTEVKKRFVFCCRQVSKLKLIVTIKIFFTFKSIFFSHFAVPYLPHTLNVLGSGSARGGQWNTNIPEKNRQNTPKYPKFLQIYPKLIEALNTLYPKLEVSEFAG